MNRSHDADFAIRYRGQQVVIEGKAAEGDSTVRYELAQAVALLPGADTALLVLVNSVRGSGDIWLLAPEGERLRAEAIVRNTSWESAEFITGDPALFQQRISRTHTRGRVELTDFAVPGLYLFRGAVFDNRDRSVKEGMCCMCPA